MLKMVMVSSWIEYLAARSAMLISHVHYSGHRYTGLQLRLAETRGDSCNAIDVFIAGSSTETRMLPTRAAMPFQGFEVFINTVSGV